MYDYWVGGTWVRVHHDAPRCDRERWRHHAPLPRLDAPPPRLLLPLRYWREVIIPILSPYKNIFSFGCNKIGFNLFTLSKSHFCHHIRCFDFPKLYSSKVFVFIVQARYWLAGFFPLNTLNAICTTGGPCYWLLWLTGYDYHTQRHMTHWWVMWRLTC